ncbi:syntaxin-12 [Onthophagus taurus]|uniref:syntaxin-12 n=1 Tax=Onthophagus taurus TaxID=166361 RepID=UPI0039BEAD78
MNRKPAPSYGAMENTAEVAFSGTSTSDFNTLCDSIVTNIYTINSSWKSLDNLTKNVGTSKDNRGLRDKIHVTQLSTNQIISATTTSLQKLSRVVKKGEKQQKLQCEKLTDNFKDAVANYSSLQKTCADKMKANLLMSPVELEEMDKDDPQAQQQILLARELAFENDMLMDREVAIKKIEADVLDVNEIMRELSVLVYQDREVIDSIENNIDYTAGTVTQATEELQKAARYGNRYRKKLFYLALIGTVILIVLIIVLVVELKR